MLLVAEKLTEWIINFKEKQPTQLIMPNSGGETVQAWSLVFFRDIFRRRKGRPKVISKSPQSKPQNSAFIKSHPNSGRFHQLMSQWEAFGHHQLHGTWWKMILTQSELQNGLGWKDPRADPAMAGTPSPPQAALSSVQPGLGHPRGWVCRILGMLSRIVLSSCSHIPKQILEKPKPVPEGQVK